MRSVLNNNCIDFIIQISQWHKTNVTNLWIDIIKGLRWVLRWVGIIVWGNRGRMEQTKAHGCLKCGKPQHYKHYTTLTMYGKQGENVSVEEWQWPFLQWISHRNLLSKVFTGLLVHYKFLFISQFLNMRAICVSWNLLLTCRVLANWWKLVSFQVRF